MRRVIQSLFFLSGLAYFTAGQYAILFNKQEYIVPLLLSAIFVVLTAIYHKESKE